MTNYIIYCTNIALSFWDSILSSIGEEPAAYMAYAFCLLSVLICFVACFWLVIGIFRYVLTLLKRGGRSA